MGEMVVYDIDDDTPSATCQVPSIEPNEFSSADHMATVIPAVSNPMNSDKASGVGLETPIIQFAADAVEHDAIAANDAGCELNLELTP